MSNARGVPEPVVPVDEVSAVIRAVGHAPHVTLPSGWHLALDADRWTITANGVPVARDASHASLLDAGITLEHVVVALEARHHLVHVARLPVGEPRVVATVRAVGQAHAQDLALTLRDVAQSPTPELAGRPLTPTDLRLLNLTVEAFGTEVLWSGDLVARGLPRPVSSTAPPPALATLVTWTDTPEDWLRAGQALARLVLRATTLGLRVDRELQVLGAQQSRSELRELWGLEGYPQAQFSLTHQP